MPITGKNPLDAINEVKKKISEYSTTLAQELEQIRTTKSADYGEPGPLLDIMGRLTGYDSAKIPLQEQLAAMHIFTKLYRYMNLRSKTEAGNKPHYESLIDSVRDLTNEGHRLYSALIIDIAE